MELVDFLKNLDEEDFHIDSLGRIVLDNSEILAAVNGAMQDLHAFHNTWAVNSGCTNSNCS